MNKKKIAAAMLSVVMCMQIFAGCGTGSNPDATESAGVSGTEQAGGVTESEMDEAAVLEDGEYTVNVMLEGGSGKATVDQQAKVTVKDGQAYATIVWSSTHYDYMIVDEQKYTNENEGGNSTFTFPISGVPCQMDVVGDTTAMSTPHEIDYTLTFHTDSIKGEAKSGAVPVIVVVVAAVCVAAGIVLICVKKRKNNAK